ncbi:hypothetical protein BU17DRAFT_98342 [Hysterangium stoloniferum]|nr:hypothetical protein BU17DRAFT_98342 [Hysterangium stoloniferum]
MPDKTDSEPQEPIKTGNARKRGASPASKAPSKRTKAQRSQKENLEVKDQEKEKSVKDSSMKKEGTTPEPEDMKHVAFDNKDSVRSVTPREQFQKDYGILERGHIYFFYRPKVAIEEARDIDDVAKLSILLIPRPSKSEDSKKNMNNLTGREAASAAPSPAPQSRPDQFFRYMVLGKKHLPFSSGKHEVFWATVVDVGHDLANLDYGLQRQVYQTKTRGERTKGAARPAGRGVYAICSPTDKNLPASRRNRTFLVYMLTHPIPPGKPQEELGIETFSSFLLQVKNPTMPSAPGVGLKREKRAKYPEEGMEEAFGEGVGATKFAPTNPTTLIDYEGAELLLIGDKKDIGNIVQNKRANEEMQTAVSEEAVNLSTDDVLRELSMDAEKFPPDALEGNWV